MGMGSLKTLTSKSPEGAKRPLNPTSMPFQEYQLLAEDRDFLLRQNRELQEIVDRAMRELKDRNVENDLDWEARIFCIEDDARNRLAESTSDNTPTAETRRVTRLVHWILAELKAIRTQRRS